MPAHAFRFASLSDKEVIHPSAQRGLRHSGDLTWLRRRGNKPELRSERQTLRSRSIKSRQAKAAD
jgi:hypothetical protein